MEKEEMVSIKKNVYNHLIKTTNVVRTRNRQLEEEVKTWKQRLIKTKKLNRKQKRLIKVALNIALNCDSFSEKYYNDVIKIKRLLK